MDNSKLNQGELPVEGPANSEVNPGRKPIDVLANIEVNRGEIMMVDDPKAKVYLDELAAKYGHLAIGAALSLSPLAMAMAEKIRDDEQRLTMLCVAMQRTRAEMIAKIQESSMSLEEYWLNYLATTRAEQLASDFETLSQKIEDTLVRIKTIYNQTVLGQGKPLPKNMRGTSTKIAVNINVLRDKRKMKKLIAKATKKKQRRR